MKEALKVSVSGVRGIVGASLTPQIASTFAQAFGALLGRGAVVVGRDTRPSGPMLEMAVVAGLQSVGCRPLLAGVIPTPSLLFLTRGQQAHGGISITASHNPVPWNALKFANNRGMFLNEDYAEELFDIYHQQDFPLVEEANLPLSETLASPVDKHFETIAYYVDASLIKGKRFKVAVDCCNGVGAVHTRAFLEERFGCEVVALHEAPHGCFERDPEPAPANLTALCRAVVAEGCAIGFAQDPDGDRLAVVNERGEPIGEDRTLALAVRQVLEHHQRGPVVLNLSTSKAVEQVARQYGSEVIRSKIGEIYVAQAMLQHQAVVGGEHTGGIMIPAIHPCRDSFAGMAVILELLAVSGESVSGLQQDIPVCHTVKEKMRIRGEQVPEVLRALRHHYKGEQLTVEDGVYVDFGDRWLHVRPSRTEPVLRINAEAPTEAEAVVIMESVLDLVARVL